MQPITETECRKNAAAPSQLRRPHALVRFVWISAFSGSLPAILNALFGHPSWPTFIDQALQGVLFSVCIGTLCTLTLPRIAQPILRLNRGLKWLSLISVIAVLAAIGCAFAMATLMVAGRVPPAQFGAGYAQAVKVCVLIALTFGVSAFFHETVVARFNRATLDLKARDEAAEKLRQVAMEARLSSLESRVQPHFLFNTLNSILALIREDPAAAEGMVERLAALLRFSLDANQSRLVPLALEAKIVRDYLEIEKARFGPRLRFTIEIPDSLQHLEIPPMSLQTLVENSVKYAVSPRREGASILVRAREEAGRTLVEVIDDGRGTTAAELKPGHGLELLQDRLAGLFGADASLAIETLSSGGTRVAIQMPGTGRRIGHAARETHVTPAESVR